MLSKVKYCSHVNMNFPFGTLISCSNYLLSTSNLVYWAEFLISIWYLSIVFSIFQLSSILDTFSIKPELINFSTYIELPFCYVQEKFLLLVGHMYQKMKVLPYILWQSSRHAQFLVLHARMVYIACIHIVSGHIKVITQYSSHLSIPGGSKTVLWK